MARWLRFEQIVYEGELGAVIGREARDVAEAQADAFIFGYTCTLAGPEGAP